MKKNGITLVAVIATITIIFTLVTTITISGISIANNSSKLNFATEIYTIKQAVDAYSVKNEGQYPVLDDIVVDLSKVTQKSLAQFSDNGENITNSQIVLQKLDYSKIDITSLRYGKENNGVNDIYAVSKLTGKVYYVKGVKISNTTYFTLTSDLLRLLEFNNSNNIVDSNNAIIFEPSNNSWTNQDLNVIVKVPKSYDVVAVTTNNVNVQKDINTSNTDLNYNIYNVINSENSVINVRYKDGVDGLEKSSKFNVQNVDKSLPILEISELIKLVSSDTIGYFSLNKATDNLSGINKIMYETEKIETNIKEYFNTSGKKVENNNIPILNGVRYITIYLEDNAGNFSYIIKEITLT